VAPAGVETPEASVSREFECPAEFVGGDAAVDFGEARFGFGFVRPEYPTWAICGDGVWK
jgi:hypothetical protein